MAENNGKLWDFDEKKWVNKEDLFTDDLVEIKKTKLPKTGEIRISYTNVKDPAWYEDYELVDWNGVKIDKKIFPLIKWLNDSGYKTTFCCSGHLLKLKILHTDDVNNERFGVKYLYERKDQLSHGYIMFDRRYPKIERLFKNYEKKRFGKKIAKTHSYVKNCDLALSRLFNLPWRELVSNHLSKIKAEPFFLIRKASAYKQNIGKYVKSGKKQTGIYFHYCNESPEVQDKVLANLEKMLRSVIR